MHPKAVGDTAVAAQLVPVIQAITGLQPLPLTRTFGSAGAGDAQLADPTAVAVNGSGATTNTGDVYVADASNHRVVEFDRDGRFLRAWGWGVADGAPHLEICTSDCETGVAGPGPGELSAPSSIAVNSSSADTAGDVYVGDGDRVEQFTPSGGYVGALTGPSAGVVFGSVAGVAVDGLGNLWVADSDNNTVYEFGTDRALEGQFSDGYASTKGIAVDDSGNVYLIDEAGHVEKWDPDARAQGPGGGASVSARTAVAVAVSPRTDDVYIDEPNGTISEYAPSGDLLSNFGGGATTDSTAIAVDPIALLSGAGGPGAVYATDAGDDDTALFVPPATSPPTVLGNTVAATDVGDGTAILNATLAGNGADTRYYFEYAAAGVYAPGASDPYGGDTYVPGVQDIIPASPGTDIGLTYALDPVSVDLAGLQPGTLYHFRLVATSTAGTTYSADATFATTGAAPAPATTPTTGGGATSSGTTSAGAGGEQSGAPRGGSARARVAEVDAVIVRRGGRIVVKVSCPGRAGQYCGVRFTLTVAERGQSDGRTKRREPNAAIVGTAKAQISPGHTRTVLIVPGSKLRNLMKPGAVRVTLTVLQETGKRSTILVRQQLVVGRVARGRS